MQKLYKTLKEYGYTHHIEYDKQGLNVLENKLVLLPDSLFFIDMAYRVMHTYVFAISAPKYKTQGILTLELNDYHTLGTSAFANKFNIEIEQSWDEIVIRRQYGMRKVLKLEFDANRYVLRKGFPDFPSCPFGHTFKSLGYDTQEKEYVRLVSSILKEKSLKIIEY